MHSQNRFHGVELVHECNSAVKMVPKGLLMYANYHLDISSVS